MIFTILIVLSWILLSLGMLGLFKFKTFYARILNNSMIDSAAFIVIMAALIIKHGWSSLSIKLLIIAVFFLLTNPIIAQMLTHATYKNRLEKEDEDAVD